MQSWRIGELAALTGLTVRTLHHYDHIGLLVPGRHGEGEYRRYVGADLLRLQRILSLRQLGLSLDEVRSYLDNGESSAELLRRHIDHLRSQITSEQRLLARLEGLAARLEAGHQPSPESLLETLEMTTMMDKHFDRHDQRFLEERRKEVGTERIRQAESEWPRLINAAQEARQANKDPSDPEVQALALRWSQLVREFSGGNQQIEGKVAEMYRKDPAVQEQTGIDPELMNYIGQAMRSLPKPSES